MKAHNPGAKLLQQAEYDNSRGRSYVNSAIRNHWRNEFIVHEVVSRTALVTVVKLLGNIGGIVCVQDRGNGVFDGPYNAIRCTH